MLVLWIPKPYLKVAATFLEIHTRPFTEKHTPPAQRAQVSVLEPLIHPLFNQTPQFFSWCLWTRVTVPYHCILALPLCSLKPRPGSPQVLGLCPLTVHAAFLPQFRDSPRCSRESTSPGLTTLSSFPFLYSVPLYGPHQICSPAVLIRSPITMALQILYPQCKLKEKQKPLSFSTTITQCFKS